MTIEFLPVALSRFYEIKESDEAIAEKIKLYISDIVRHPETGMGEPTALKGPYEGVWQRKLSLHEALYYSFDNQKVVILSIVVATSHSGVIEENVGLTPFSADEYAAVMAQMSANRGKDSEPKVGIFWYNRARNELFGVVSHRISDYSKANASEGRITCSEMHEDIWKREYRKRKYHGDDMGPYIGAYQDKPRGRVFYRVETDTFEVAVGNWIKEYPQAYDLVLNEFDLPPDKTEAKYAIHWDIGMSWR